MSKTFNKNIPYNYSGSSNLGVMFRNKVINGDMQLDVRNSGNGVGGVSGNFLTYNAQPTLFNTVDRFSISSPNVGALTAKQLTLSSSDSISVGNLNTALAVGLVPNDSLSIYLPMDSSLIDLSGNNLTATTVGNIQYVTGPVSSNVTGGALYLANESNVVASPTYASNYAYLPYTQAGNSLTVSFWMNCSKLPVSGSSSVLGFTNSGRTVGGLGVLINYLSPTSGSLCGTYNTVSNTPTFTITTNVWYHVTVNYIPSTSYSFYVNGSLIGSITNNVPSNFNSGPVGAANSFLIIGDRQNSGGGAMPFAGMIDDLRIYNRILSATEIAALDTNVGIGVAPNNTSFTSRLTFDNTTADAQGTLSAPTATGITTYIPVSQVGSASLDLTANTAGSISPVNNLLYNLSSFSPTTFTIAGWINCSTLPPSTQFSMPICLGTTTSRTFQFTIPNSGIPYIEGSIQSVAASSTLVPGIWYHLCAVITPTSSSLYLNGILQGYRIVATNTLGTTNVLRIGGPAHLSTDFCAFKGFVDDVRIYTRVLSSQEVSGLYNSSQYASYSIFQQDIDGRNLADFAWGTPSAQPATASMWLKNNSPTAQQFSISANNAGSNLISWLQFENNYTDSLSFLNNLTTTGSVALTSSIVKVGGFALDLTANTVATAAVAIVNYNVPMALQTPFTVSFWMYANNVSTTQVPFCMGPGPLYNNPSHQFSTEVVLTSAGRVYVDVMSNATFYSSPASTSTLTANTWNHVCYSVSSNTIILYLNGVAVASRADLPTNGLLSSYNGNSPNYGQTSMLRLGNQMGNNQGFAFKGYLDDVRIYNRVLTPTQINQLYLNNVNSTVASNYLTPRSIVYNTPSIPANSWQRVSFTMPGDSTGNWLTTQETGMTLSLALGASPLYNTTNVATASGNSNTVWNNIPEYIGSSVQQYASSGSNLLSSITNSVYVTGVQLEKGSVSTQFDTRNITSEHLLANTIVNNGSMTLMASGGNVGIGTTSPQTTLHVNGYIRGSIITFHAVSSHGTYNYVANTIVTGVAGQGWDSIIHNIGNCWNATTGYFTPTVAGYYSITVNAYLNATGSGFSIRKNATTSANGTEIGGSWSNGNIYGTTTVIVYLNGTTDNVSVWSNAVQMAISTAPANFINGYLIMPA